MEHNINTKIDKEKILLLPQARYTGPIIRIQTLKEFEQHEATLAKETLLGFDTESRPSFNQGEKHPVSLVQLATAEAVYLVQLHEAAVAQQLAPILSNPGQLKVGIAVHDDIRALQDQIAFTPRGFAELSDFTRTMGIIHTGLRNLAALLLGVRISKAAQMSDWSKLELRADQCVYAATDAWIAREIYCKLKKLGRA